MSASERSKQLHDQEYTDSISNAVAVSVAAFPSETSSAHLQAVRFHQDDEEEENEKEERRIEMLEIESIQVISANGTLCSTSTSSALSSPQPPTPLSSPSLFLTAAPLTSPAPAEEVQPKFSFSTPSHSSMLMHEMDVYSSFDLRDEAMLDEFETQHPFPAATVAAPLPLSSSSVTLHIAASSNTDSTSATFLTAATTAAFSSSPPLVPASSSSSSSTSSPSAPGPSWLNELRSVWEETKSSSTAVPTQQQTENTRDTALRAARAAASDQSSYHKLLSPAVQATPPLGGDVVWNAPSLLRRITLFERDSFLLSSKHAQYRFFRMHSQILSMFLPVSLLSLAILIYSYSIVQNERNPLLAGEILVYKERKEEETWRKWVGSICNGLTVLAAIIFITLIFIFFSWKEWRRGLRIFLISILFLLLLPWVYFSLQTIEFYEIPVDVISFVLVEFNLIALALFGLVSLAETRRTLNRLSLLAISLSVSWPFMEFSEWTVWTTLIILTLYDLLAVLAPCGPLKFIMDREAAQKRSGLSLPAGEKLPGLMYHGKLFMLGLGDLIFYGALMGRAAKEGFIVLVPTVLGVLMGVAGTILWSYHTRANAIPALPLSVLFGLSFYAATSLSILPSMEHAARHGWQT